MNWLKGINDCKKILFTLESDITDEKKIRKVFIESDLITSDDASAEHRDDIHKWREKILISDLPNLRENEVANSDLAKIQKNLLEEIEQICNNIIKDNTDQDNTKD